MSKVNIIFDSQVLNSIQLCALRTKLYFQDNFRLPQVAEPLETGDLLHKILEKYYLGHKEGGTVLLYSDEAFKTHVDSCITFGEQYSTTLSLTAESTDEVIKHFTENVNFFRMDGMVVEKVESAFIVPLHVEDDLGIYYSGKIDLIANMPTYGRVLIDHKSQRRATDPDILSNQFTGYSFATGIPNVMINRVGFQKTYTAEKRFTRPVLLYSQDLINRWKTNTIWWGRQYAFFLEFGEWPENRTSCDKYGGCVFQRICGASTDEAREWIKQSAYIIGEKWDPTKALIEDSE